MKTFNIIQAALLSLLMLVVHTTSAATIDANQYQAFYGDIDGDGDKDIYLTPKPKFVLIASDVVIPIPLKGEGDSYKLLAQQSGYAEPVLDNNVDTSKLSSGWFNLHSVDLNGDNSNDVFIQSTDQSLLSFTLANSWGEDPYFIQTFTSIGSDTHTLTVTDSNNDGRDDVVLTAKSGSQDQTLYGNKQGHLTNSAQSQITAHYGYDYLNKRKYKVVDTLGGNQNNNPREQVLYIDDDTELRDGKLYKYIRVGGKRIARTDQTGGTFSPTEWYLNNHLGSVQLTLDSTATVKTATTYEPYGEKRNTWGQTALAPYGFTGKEQDPETGLGYFHNRYLNHVSGQFITPDPVFTLEERFTDPQHWSPYAYGRNNPIVYIDPNGEVAKVAVTAGKLIYKAYKQFRATGKIDKASIKKAGMDELVGIADDLNTLFLDDKKGFFDKLGAGVDLLTGLETTDGDVRELAGILEGRKGKRSYSDPTKRPKYGKNQVRKVWEQAKGRDGKVRDPNTYEVLSWDQFKSRAGQWDMGHIKGEEYRKLHKSYIDGKLSKPEFLEKYRDSSNYLPESISSNRSRRHEIK